MANKFDGARNWLAWGLWNTTVTVTKIAQSISAKVVKQEVLGKRSATSISGKVKTS